MIVCEICKKHFKSFHSLSSHLSYPNSSCKINIKEYYDKYLRKPNEGICKFCGKETMFYGLTKGYINDVCKICNRQNLSKSKNYKRSISIKNTLRKKRELKNKRIELINVLRKRTIQKNKLQCQICGKLFKKIQSVSIHIRTHDISLQEYYDKFFKSPNEDICLCHGEVLTCKKYTTFISLEKGYGDYCSLKCISLSPIVKDDKQKTCLNKYGVNHQSKVPEINHKQKIGVQKAYKNNLESILKKRRKSFLDNTFFPKMKKFLDNIDTELIEYNDVKKQSVFKCKKCNTIFKRMWDSILNDGCRCPKCFPISKRDSIAENEITDYVKSIYDGEVLKNNFNVIKNPKTKRSIELDIYIPEKYIAFEYNGLYYHSELKSKDPINYHLMKTNECKKKGIQLIHIFEDEWLQKKELVKRMIANRIGKNLGKRIYARQCIIKEISPKEKNEFLEEYHIQGKDSSVIKLGAFYNNKLVSLMTFSHGSISKGGDTKNKLKWELNRFCSNYNFHIIGIAGKLLKYFQRNYEWKEIFSYADLRWSIGNLYYKLGFELKHISKPNYWYVDKYGKRIHRFNLRKRPNEPKNITEKILRFKEGYIRIWDCGNLKFELNSTIP